MIKHYNISNQAYGEFNDGDIIENKPLGFPQDSGKLKPYSNLFYWAHASAKKDSVIGLHPHRGFEIMSIVLEGNIQHYDTLLKQWIPLEKGDVQLIQSGSGISHAEAMQNESEIFPLLKKFNFEIVFPEEMTFEEQIEIYHGANIMGGLHGGGLTNILFMNPGTKLLEVRRENDNLNNCYYTLASELGINYYYVNSKSQGDDLYVSDTIINLIDLENLLIKVTS